MLVGPVKRERGERPATEQDLASGPAVACDARCRRGQSRLKLDVNTHRQNPSATPENTKTKTKKMRDVEVRMAEVVAAEKVEINLSETFDRRGSDLI